MNLPGRGLCIHFAHELYILPSKTVSQVEYSLWCLTGVKTQLCHCPSMRAEFNSLRSSWENMPCSFGAITSVECIVAKIFHMADSDAHTIYLIHNKYPNETNTVPHSVFQKRKLRHNTNMYINLKVTCPQVTKPIICILTQSLSHWLLNVVSDF